MPRLVQHHRRLGVDPRPALGGDREERLQRLLVISALGAIALWDEGHLHVGLSDEGIGRSQGHRGNPACPAAWRLNTGPDVIPLEHLDLVSGVELAVWDSKGLVGPIEELDEVISHDQPLNSVVGRSAEREPLAVGSWGLDVVRLEAGRPDGGAKPTRHLRLKGRN
jgi:hypothetical protein